MGRELHAEGQRTQRLNVDIEMGRELHAEGQRTQRLEGET